MSPSAQMERDRSTRLRGASAGCRAGCARRGRGTGLTPTALSVLLHVARARIRSGSPSWRSRGRSTRRCSPACRRPGRCRADRAASATRTIAAPPGSGPPTPGAAGRADPPRADRGAERARWTGCDEDERRLDRASAAGARGAGRGAARATAVTRVVARRPPHLRRALRSQLPPLLRRPGDLAGRHLDADDRPGVAGAHAHALEHRARA